MEDQVHLVLDEKNLLSLVGQMEVTEEKVDQLF